MPNKRRGKKTSSLVLWFVLSTIKHIAGTGLGTRLMAGLLVELVAELVAGLVVGLVTELVTKLEDGLVVLVDGFVIELEVGLMFRAFTYVWAGGSTGGWTAYWTSHRTGD